jgi:predicted aspartyl protease
MREPRKTLIKLCGLFAFAFATAFLVFTPNAMAKSAAEFSAKQRVEFSRMPAGQYLLDVMINDQGPFKFMVDSAATRSCLFENTAKQLGITEYDGVDKYVNGITGSGLRPTTTVKSYKFAKQEFDDHLFVVLEDWPDPELRIDGIVGMDVLKDLVLSFNHTKNRVRISQRSARRRSELQHWRKIKLAPNPYPNEAYELLFTYAELGAIQVPAMIDTGASFTAISWQTIKGTKVADQRQKLRDAWVIGGAIGEFSPKIRIKMDQFGVGGRQYDHHELLVMDFDSLPITDGGKYPLLIAGIDLFGGRDFVFDFPDKALYLAPTKEEWDRSHRRNISRGLNAIDY